MYFWAREMSADEMLQFTGSCNHSLDKTGDWLLPIHHLNGPLKHLPILKFADMFFDWNNLDYSTINSEQMTVSTDILENVCKAERTTPVLIGKGLR